MTRQLDRHRERLEGVRRSRVSLACFALLAMTTYAKGLLWQEQGLIELRQPSVLPVKLLPHEVHTLPTP
jgi:hypothetical protein